MEKKDKLGNTVKAEKIQMMVKQHIGFLMFKYKFI